jgi:hypothetical protein
MDQFTRRIIGFGIHRGTVDGSVMSHVPAGDPAEIFYPNISAPTTIPYIASINGRPTFAFWR